MRDHISMEENTSKKPNVLLISVVILFIVAIVTIIALTSKVLNKYEATSCTYNGIIYQSGDHFRDNCNTCLCQNGEIECTLLSCDYEEPVDEAPVIDGIRLPNKPTHGSDCYYEDQYFSDGDQFRAIDGCNSCICSGKEVACTDMACSENTQ